MFSQKEANIWHFGWYVGLDFKNDPPDTLSCNFKHSSVSTMCDTEGNLLFTANGPRIINRTLDVSNYNEKIENQVKVYRIKNENFFIANMDLISTSKISKIFFLQTNSRIRNNVDSNL